jgi:hypothetical protein
MILYLVWMDKKYANYICKYDKKVFATGTGA